MDIKVSIVVPIYNQEKNLDCSMPSILGQDWNNIEVLLVNDGSTDKSEEIIDRYAAKDTRIKKINKQNGGLVDAVINGIENASGDYICFVDPDDFVGPMFVSTFMSNIGNNDFIAMGYLEFDGNNLREKPLDSDYTYDKQGIEQLKKEFLFKANGKGVAHSIFISRWNKCYKTSVIKRILSELKECKNVSLGEDTIFTYLVLNNCKTCIALQAPNCYVYNTSSSTSMMKNGAVTTNMQKAEIAYEVFKNRITRHDGDIFQADMLYYFLVNSVINRIKRQYTDELSLAYRTARTDQRYLQGLRMISQGTLNWSDRLLRIIPNAKIYHTIYKLNATKLIPLIKYIRKTNKELSFIFRDAQNVGLIKALRLYKYRRLRRNAFKDVKKELPKLERQIVPILEPWKEKVTSNDQSKIIKNVFVFWYDGFDNAPEIVKACLASIVRMHPGYNIVEIDKNNFQDYTDIHPVLIEDFHKGKISIQTFSDILRFNLLKNNGGVWIDSTIAFVDKYDLVERLSKQPINSLVFSSSNSFLSYKGEVCTWSGYYFASQKGSVFVSAVYDVFEKYYIRYKKYPIYFFVDAVLMICKIYKIDNEALCKTQQNWGDMSFFASVINSRYSKAGEFFMSIVPQKLSWFIDIDYSKSETYFNTILRI